MNTIRRNQMADFYREQGISINVRVARRIRAPQATVEDACQHAWMLLMRRDDIDLDRGRAGG